MWINVYICAYAVQCHLPPVPHHDTVAHNLFKMLNRCHGDVTDRRVDVSHSMMSWWCHWWMGNDDVSVRWSVICLYEVWKLHLHFEGLKNTILWKSKILSNWTEMNCYQWLKMPCEWLSSLIYFPKCGALGKVNTFLWSVCFKNNLPDYHKHNITSLSHASQQHL